MRQTGRSWNRPGAVLLAAMLLTGAATGQGSCPDLVARYGFDEAAGASFADSSGNGLDGQWLGGPVLGGPGVSAATGASVELDGVDDRGTVTDAPPLTNLRSDLSVCAWVRPDVLGGRRRVFGNDGSWTFGLDGTGLVFTTRTVKDYVTAGNLQADVWAHVAAVFDANFDVMFYVDGQPIGFVAGGAPANPPVQDWFVGTYAGTIEWLDGELDDLQVYEGSLSAAQILYMVQNPGSTAPCAQKTYCTGKLNSQACTPAIVASGAPSASNAGPFDVSAFDLINNKSGMFFYGLSGRLNLAFQGGVLCVLPPLKRTMVQGTGGNPPPADCSGTLAIDFNQWMQKGHGANLLPVGTQAWGQFWYLDPLDPFGVGLSNAIEFTVGP